jgi:hypothetical protein
MLKFMAGIPTFVALTVLAAPAVAQSSTDTEDFQVVGNVPALCTGGTVSGGNSTFDLGVLTDTSTGFLRSDLTVPQKVITGSFCSSRSTIRVQATPMLAQNFTAVPPPGFSRTVNYVASAVGWTASPAQFSTAQASNPNAVQSRDTAFTGDIVVSLSSFSTGGGEALRLVADNNYLGTVTVTLSAVE